MRRGADSGRRHIQTAAAVLFIAVDLFCFGRILTGDGRIAWPLLPQRLFGFYNQDVAVLALVFPAVYGEQRHGRQRLVGKSGCTMLFIRRICWHYILLHLLYKL